MVALEPNVRIIALDPGETTGWACWSALAVPGMPRFSTGMSQSYTCGHLTRDSLRGFLGNQRVATTIVVCERFDNRHNEKNIDPAPIEVIGIIKEWCEENDITLVMQSVGNAKHFVKDINLKRLGMWHGKKWKHAMDGFRHLVYYMIHGEPGRKDLLRKGWPNT